MNESADEVGGFSTVDHADIRGSAFAAFMVTIRRELPRTGLADLAAQRTRGFSTVGWLARWLVHFGLAVQAATPSFAALSARSDSTPMAQTKPASSRASAVTILAVGLLLLERAQ